MNGAPLRHVVSIKKRACHHKVSLPSLSCAATSLFQQSWASRCFRHGPEPREVSDAVSNSYEPRSYGESCHAQVCYFNGGRFIASWFAINRIKESKKKPQPCFIRSRSLASIFSAATFSRQRAVSHAQNQSFRIDFLVISYLSVLKFIVKVRFASRGEVVTLQVNCQSAVCFSWKGK